MKRFDVAIVGLGPTGAVLGNLCGLYGLNTVIYERSPAMYPQPRACHLDGEVARILAQCGFAEQLHQVLTRSDGMEFVDADGQRVFTYEGFERVPLLGWHEDYVFVQPELDAVVRGGLDRFQHVEARIGVEAPPIEEMLRDAHWIVGCDGASSRVRSELGIGLRDLGYDREWLVVDVDLDAHADVPLPTIIQQVCDPARLTTFVPSHGAHRRWEFRLGVGERLDPWSALSHWGVTADNATLLRAAPYRFHALVAEHWRGGASGRVLLAGDAAHQMPPFMGQGMCSGIRDAAAIAWRLAAGDLLGHYERERRPHVEAVTEMSIEAGLLLETVAADLAAGRRPVLPSPAPADPTRWSRLPGLDLGGEYPIGHQVPGPPGLDARLGLDWAWVAADDAIAAELRAEPGTGRVFVEPAATCGSAAVLVRPDRYIAAVRPP